ncbi:MAG: alpha-amylase [Moraxellaceae bacterium]|nr:MAG: alpha-amylase [Moraxellaceae bacterium]
MQDRSTLFFYHIYPLGACGAPEANDFTSAPVGRLRDLLTWIPHIKNLGCNALYLGPVFESDFHGYDTADYFTVDRRLGTNSTLKELSAALHDAGIMLVLDTVFNHVGRNFWAFKDLQAHGESSIYKDWFCGLDFTRQSSYNDAFYYDGWYDAYNLVKLNLTNPDVKRYLFSVVDFWEAEFGIAGLRLDVAEIMDKQFLAELAAICRKKKQALWLLGEMISGDYKELANPDMLDSTTNYELYKSLYSSHNEGNYYELAHTLNRQTGEQGLYRNLQLYTFVDNHDTTRIASILNNEQHLFTVYALLFTMPGIPSIYYGSEWGVKGIKGDHEDSALRPEVNLLPDLSYHALFLHIQRLAEIRAQCPALRLGIYKDLYVSHHQLIFSRTLDQEVCLIAVNNTAQSISLTIDAIGTNVFVDQLNNDYRSESKCGVIDIEIPGYGARILCLLT